MSPPSKLPKKYYATHAAPPYFATLQFRPLFSYFPNGTLHAAVTVACLFSLCSCLHVYLMLLSLVIACSLSVSKPVLLEVAVLLQQKQGGVV